MIKKMVLSLSPVLVPMILLLCSCASGQELQFLRPPGETQRVTANLVVPQPRSVMTMKSDELARVNDVISTLIYQRLMELATSQDAKDFVNSFFTDATGATYVNGDPRGDGRYVRCPENAWWRMIYGTFPTAEGGFWAEIDGKKFFMYRLNSPERWRDAVWLVYTDGRVEPFRNEFSPYPDNAFNVEEDILKLNRGLQLNYNWRRE